MHIYSMACAGLRAGVVVTSVFVAPAALTQTTDTSPGTALDIGEVVVEADGFEQTTAGPVEGYRALTADSGTRTRTPIEEIPQSIVVVPRSVIDDQQADSVSDVTRNVSGVQGKQRRERTQQLDGDFVVRGQFTELYVNGRNTFFDQGLDPESTINVERVEVIKGPTSSLFSQANGAPVSGVVNIVEKTPFREAAYSIEGAAGQFDFYNAAFDLNQPLTKDGDLALRVTGDLRTSDNFVDRVDDQTGAIFPTLRYDNGETAVTLRGRYQQSEFLFYNGVPTDGPDFPAAGLGATDFVGALDQPETELRSFSVDLLAEHNFSDQLTGRFRVGYQDADGDQSTSTSGVPPLFGFFGDPADPLVRTDSRQLLQVNLFDVGGEAIYEHNPLDVWEHTMLAGLEYQSTNSDGLSFFGVGPSGDLETVQVAPFDTSTFPATPFGLDIDTLTGIFQSQSTLYDRYHFLAGVSASDARVRTEGIPEVGDVVLSPRVGLAVDVVDGITPFVGWGRGFRTPQGVVASAITSIEAVEIERNEQVEVGVRFSNRDLGLSGSLAFYNLERKDAAVFVAPAAQTTQVNVADQRSRGFEADVVWQPTREFKILTNYAFTDAEITGGLSDFEGNELQRVPAHSGRIALRYDFVDGPLNGFGVGAGMTGVTEQAGDLGNTFFTEGYVVFDAQASYKVGNVEAGLSVENIFDNDVFVPNFFFQGNTGPIQPLTETGKVKITF